MLLLSLFLFRLSTSQSSYICVCHLDECDKSCPKSDIGEVFETVQPNNFEQYIVSQSQSSRILHSKYEVFVTFNDQPIQFSLSSFNNLHISFHKYFIFTNISNLQSKILVKFKNDDDSSSAKLFFSESDVVITNSNQNNLQKSTLTLDYLQITNRSTLSFEKKSKITILKSKCCHLNDFSLAMFNEIYVENGFCQNDFSLTANSIQKLHFEQNLAQNKNNLLMSINEKVDIFGALNIKIASTDNSNLDISAVKDNVQNKAALSLDNYPRISLYSFGQILFDENSDLNFLFFNINHTEKIVCKAPYLPANFHDSNFYVENDIFINGTISDLSIFSTHNNNFHRISLTFSDFYNNLNIQSSFIDIIIINFNVNSENPITFCVGNGGISKVTIKSIVFNPELAIDTIFSKLVLNRDFKNYLSDSDLSQYLYKNNIYLELPTSKKYLSNVNYENSIPLHFTDSSSMIHGFYDHDSILTPTEISENPQVFAVYLDSPSKKVLKLCLSSATKDDDCIKINAQNMNSFTNDFLSYNPEIENVLIDIQNNFESEQFNFESFFVNNLTITANSSSNVKFGTFNFIGKVASNLTIENIHNFDLNIIPNKNSISTNIKNIGIFNCQNYNINSNISQKVYINNFSISQKIQIPSNLEIDNFNYFIDFVNETFILASYNYELLYLSPYEFFNLSTFANFNVYLPFDFGQNTEKSVIQKKLYIFLSAKQTPKCNIHITSKNVTLYFSKWEDFPTIFDEWFNRFNYLHSSPPPQNSSDSNLTIYNSDFDVKAYFSFHAKNINFVGNGFVSKSIIYFKKKNIYVDLHVNERLDSELNKISNEDVSLIFDQHSFIPSLKTRIKLESIHDKVIHFQNYQTKNQKLYLYDITNSGVDVFNNNKIILSRVDLYLKSQKLSNHEEGLNDDKDDDDDDDDDEIDHHFTKVQFDDIVLYENSTFKGFSSDEITFRRLNCSLEAVCSLKNKITIGEQLVLSGQIGNISIKTKKKIYFQPGSFLNLTLRDQKMKISIGERLISIGNFVFVGLSHAEIIIEQNSGYDCAIEPIKNDDNKINFDLLPRVAIIQKSQAKTESKILQDEKETYKIVSFMTKSKKTITKRIKENQFVNFSNMDMNVQSIQKVRTSELSYPQPSSNVIHLNGEWTGCKPNFFFHNLADVDFYTESEIVPFHFFSTAGHITLYVSKKSTSFLGRFHFTNAQKTASVDLISQRKAHSSKFGTNVTFCEKFGGLMNVSFHFYQPGVYACFKHVSFDHPNSLTFHLFMSVDGYSSFSTFEGSHHVNSIIYLSFICALDLTDPRIEEFLSEEEKIMGLFVDPSFTNRPILSWEVFPETHGLYESYKIFYSRRTNKLSFVQRTSPYDVPWSICLSNFDICDTNIDALKNLDDIRPLIPKGKKSILFLLTESFDEPVNFDYEFFNGFSISCIGMGLIELNLKLGKNRIVSLDFSDVFVNIVDDNYSLDFVRIEGYSKLTNSKGIKKLQFGNFQAFKNCNIESFKGRILIPSMHDQIVFQKGGVKLIKYNNPDATLVLSISRFPDVEIIFNEGKNSKEKEFLIDEDVNERNLPQISLNFATKVAVLIGKGWDKIGQKTALKDVYGASNIDQITAECFPFQPLSKLLNHNSKKKFPVPVILNESLFPLKVPSESTFCANESMVLNLPSDSSSASIHFENTVFMHDNSSIEVLNSEKYRVRSSGIEDSRIEMNKLIVSKNASVSVASTRIADQLEVEESSVLMGNLNFMPNSTLVINGKVNIQAFELLKFPSIIFDTYPQTSPARITVKLTYDKPSNDELMDEIVEKMEMLRKVDVPSLSSLENNPGVIVSNLGFMCSRWVEIIKITGTQHFFFVPICVKGYLKIVRIMNSDTDTETETPKPIYPTMTPFKINLSEFVHPTMTPINRGNEASKGISVSIIGVIVMASIFVIFFVVLMVVVFKLKKKYTKLFDVQDEDDDNRDINNNDVIKL